jgi:hypothetical protein
MEALTVLGVADKTEGDAEYGRPEHELRSPETVTIAAVAFLCIAGANSPPVTFESPCECRDAHGKHRWSVKIDPSTPPADASAIQAVKAGGVSVQSPAERKGGSGSPGRRQGSCWQQVVDCDAGSVMVCCDIPRHPDVESAAIVF